MNNKLLNCINIEININVKFREEEGPNIKTYLTLNNIHIREIPHMATMYKSALLPLHNVSCGGTVYKSGNEVSVLLQGSDDEVIVKIINFGEQKLELLITG